MTAATATQPARPLISFRDDGPIAGAVGVLLRRVARVPPAALVVAGAVPLLAAIAIEGNGASDAVVGAAIAWLIVVAGASAGRPDEGRFRWIAAPGLRLAEYSALIWMGASAGGSGVAAAFALLCALAFRHYDIVYRFRHQGRQAPTWVGVLGGGWAGRLIVAYVLLLLDALPVGLFVAAGVLGAVFVAESASSWARAEHIEAADVYDDEEDEEA